MPGLLSRYIFKEIALPFILCIVILTSTALLSKAITIVEMMLTHGVGPSFIFWFVVSVAPSLLIYTIPISFLAAVMIAFTRLSSDHEITAMKAGGISLFNLARPVVAVAVITTLITLAFTVYLFPSGNRLLKELVFDLGRTGVAAAIEEKTFYDKFADSVLYVDRYSAEDGTMHGVFISTTDSDGEPMVFIAPEGVIAPSGAEDSVRMRLYDGTMHKRGTEGGSYQMAGFSTYMLELRIAGEGPAPSGPEGRPNRELYPSELATRIERVEARGDDPASYIIDLHKRFALPASVFVFSLIGVPLGIQRVRSARMAGFSTALGVVLVYYLLSTIMEVMGEAGTINPVAAVWGSDIVFAGVGIYIFIRTARDCPACPGWLSSAGLAAADKCLGWRRGDAGGKGAKR